MIGGTGMEGHGERHAGTPAFAARGLTQSFSGGLGRARKGVLHGIDLELAAGRTLGLVGPNGSGKSTLLRVLAAAGTPRR